MDRIRDITADIKQGLVRADSRADVESRTCEIISQSDPYLLAWIGELDPDTSDRKQRKRELEEKNKRLDEFAGVVSHDLRNPLNVAELADSCWQTVDTAEARLRADIDRQIRADPARLKRLLENLFSNAVEHGSTSPPSQAQEDTGGEASEPSVADAPEDAVEHCGSNVTVTVGALPDGFYVEDDGLGVPADDCDRLFEAGYSTAEEGTGFGLSIVQAIAEAHGWDVTATDGDDGARFEIIGVERA